jgi:RNA polymerase sigma factor (TIGR02999 family)
MRERFSPNADVSMGSPAVPWEPASGDDETSRAEAAASPGEITRLLQAWKRGEDGAEERLVAAVYGELRKIAVGTLALEHRDHTLQPTAVVHEAYLRLVGQRRVTWQNRSHFFGIAAKMIRRILVDHSRRRRAAKRNSGVRVALDEVDDLAVERPELLVELDAALALLAVHDPLGAKVVELRFFGGLTGDETAEVLGTSPATVKRLWRAGRAFLFHELTRRPGAGMDVEG